MRFWNLLQSIEWHMVRVLMRSERVHTLYLYRNKRWVITGQGVIAEGRWRWLARWRYRQLQRMSSTWLPPARVVKR